ncbi:hypothetical protein U8527_03915 [Kordia algicida OT-1]|uniref:YD repeat-containing protein n=1 Tax=Kordia algicida OT-1 TaxID=391587 RepID=A9DPM3_9FLAO|nr:hypothetical protein [Kordia algicida]EDP97470.1 hypothetical protein KAOT1_19947 [Kordia algicida OT-1]
MKKTLLITSVLLAFFCFSCDDEPLDSNIAIENPTSGGGNNGGGNNGGGNGGGNNGGGNNGGGNSGTTLSTYTYDVSTNAPIFGEIITDTDFNIQQGLVVSQNIDLTIFGTMTSSLSTYTRDGNGRIISIQDNANNGQNTTTITYTGDNITQIEYDFSADDTDDYVYTFTYSGNTVTKTVEGTNSTAVFTFDSNSRLTRLESFENGTSTQVETLTYAADGNCTQTSVEANGSTTTNTYTYDSFTNPLKAVFADTYLISVFNGDPEDEVGAIIANFHSSNNWIGGNTSEGSYNFNPMYDTNNNILSKGGNYDLGDGVTVTQSEVYQY